MEGRKENKYNLSGICPECGKLIKLELVVATELVETGKTEAKEGAPDADKGETEGTGSGPDESRPVRPVDGKAGTSEAGPGPAADNSVKGKRTKKTGGG